MSKTNDIVHRRLAEVRMSDHDRIRAAAQLERAEAIADLLGRAANAIGRLFKSEPAPLRRPTTSVG